MDSTSSEITNQTAEVERGSAAQQNWLANWSLLAGLLPLVGLAPMLAIQMAGIWQRPHLFYTPVMLAIVAAIGWARRLDQPCKTALRLWIAIGLLGLSAVVATVAVGYYSPWLAHVAAIVIFVAWALGRWGTVSWIYVTATGLLLLSTLPWPNGLDLQFNHWLKHQSGSYVSAALDAFSVPNLLTDRGLRTRSLTLLFAEIASFTSVFALFASGGLIGFLRQRSGLHTLLLLFSAPLWWVTYFSFGILAAIYLEWDFGTGQQWFWFLAALSSLLLFDQFLGAMLQPAPITEPDFGQQFFVMNQMLVWPNAEILGDDLPPEDPDELVIYQLIKRREAEQEVAPEVNWFDLKHAPWIVRGSAAICLLTGIAPAILLASGGNSRTTEFQPVAESELGNFTSVELSIDSGLARQLDAWLVTDFNTQPTTDRQPATLEWKYNWRGQAVTARVTFPFNSWKGQVEVDQEGEWVRDFDASLQLPNSPWILGLAEFVNPFGGRSYVVQTALTDDLQPLSLEVDERISRAENQRFPIFRMLSPSTSGQEKLLYYLTAQCESGVSLSQAEQLELQRSFATFCQAVQSNLRPDQLKTLVIP